MGSGSGAGSSTARETPETPDADPKPLISALSGSEYPLTLATFVACASLPTSSLDLDLFR